MKCRDHLSECGGCGSDEQLILHNVRHRGTYRRLCTACVLKNHSESFCPICFHVFHQLPPPQDRVMCLKCPSISHLSCVGFDVAPRYQCPPCSNPNFAFFDVFLSNKRIKGSDAESERDDETKRGINKDSAKALLAAARIASASMSKAAAVSRVEAERRVKEAALAKKRAREALERVAYLVCKEKEKDKDSKDSKGILSLTGSASVVSAQKRIQNQVKVDRIDKLGAVPASLGHVGSTGTEKRLGFQVKDIVLRPPNNGISVGGNDKRTSNVQGEKDINGLVSVSSVAGEVHRQQSSHGNED